MRGGVESPIRPVLAGRRGLRQQAGVVSVATIAIAVIAAGFGLGGLGTEALPSPSGGPSVASGTVTSAAGSPAATATPVPALTELPGLGCLPAEPGRLPEFRLWSTAGIDTPVRGVAGPTDAFASPPTAFASPPTAGWPIPDQRIALPLDPSSSVVLIPDGEVCVRHVDAEYLGVDDLGETPTAFGSGAWNVNPPSTRVVLGGLPSGDWVVRVVASYSTGVAGDDDQAVVERFFRVVTHGPESSPLIAPAVPCVPLPAGSPAPRLALVAGDDAPVLGVDTRTYLGDIRHNGMLVTGTFPERLELWVVGDACATSWQITYVDPATGSSLGEIEQANLGEVPYYVSQNRIRLQNAVFGQSVVSATVSFGRDRRAEAAWELTLVGPPPPAARLSGSNGARAVARPGCGVGWTLASGQSAYEMCLESPVPADLELLVLGSGETVRVEVPGWRILSWWVSCGERSSTDGTFRDSEGCALGGGGDGTSDAGPVIFLPFPGRHIVSIWISADRDGDIVGAQYFIEVDAGP